ncbi:hypothetical protein [endosymbiont GvMRE of Glomus versiforme]|uniref:hypothetical protein n=1 Tax=endosymbiont GvMRE of Glomus versiforme TaxID=2039283 RepID=UPI000ED6382D|nr:hypothetical protein [endosymbiont GvMRE of Glomus versiforme]RHZ36582.1 hypothetical protein GvMRE_I2g522 [endosymbiont GvMRE of Glomus versiforme]
MKCSGDTSIIKDEQIAYISMEKASKIRIFHLKNGDEVIDSNLNDFWKDKSSKREKWTETNQEEWAKRARK